MDVIKYLLLFILLLLLLTYRLEAQQPLLQKQITLYEKQTELQKLLQLTSKQTGVKFSFNTQKIKPESRVNISSGKHTLQFILKQINQSLKLEYTVMGNHIILFQPKNNKQINTALGKSNKNSPLLNKKDISFKAKGIQPSQTNKNTVLSKRIAINDTLKTVNTGNLVHTLPDTVITNLQTSYLEQLINTIKANDSSTVFIDSPFIKNKPNRNQAPVQSTILHPTINSSLFRPFIKVFATSDEIFFTGAGISAGLPLIHAALSWNTNFNFSGVRYSGGTSFKLSDTWRLTADFSKGKLKKSFDTSGQPGDWVTVKDRLNRFGIGIEKLFSQYLSFQVTAHFNNLKRTFFFFDVPVSTGQIPGADKSESKYQIVKPPYTINNNYSLTQTPVKKTWIGLQLSLFCDFNFFK